MPFIAEAGIKNAAGQTPDGAVAPGSIISIYGESLAPRLEISDKNPLAQTLADVVVTVADRILPLLFVSPQQINAQVPSDLGDGDYSLKVQWTGKPAVIGRFTVARNAPGLFSRPVNDVMYTLASHEDGSPVTPDSPVRKGELVTVYGTGFGPFNQRIIDGFIFPVPSQVTVVDPVEITAGESTIRPEWTGGAPGFVGAVITRFRVTAEMPGGTNVELKVAVNGKLSNVVLLPIE